MLNNCSEDKVKMMEKEYIDVDYTEREDTPQPKNGDITICADPT